MQHLFCLCASLTIRMRKLQCEGGKICLSITWESYVISNEPEKKIMWQIRDYLAGKGKTEHWVVWELCLTLLQVCVLTYTFPSLFIFPFWSQIRIRVGLCFLYAIVTFQFIKIFAQVYNTSFANLKGYTCFCQASQTSFTRKSVTICQRHQDKGISCENLSGFYTSKDLIIQYL